MGTDSIVNTVSETFLIGDTQLERESSKSKRSYLQHVLNFHFQYVIHCTYKISGKTIDRVHCRAYIHLHTHVSIII